MKLRPFEVALFIGFGIAGALALILLSTYQGDSEEEFIPNSFTGTINIWGTLPPRGMNEVIESLADTNPSFERVKYTQVTVENFNLTLLSALANQTPPDLLLLPHEMLAAYRQYLSPFTYQSFPLRDFRNQYLDGAELFAQPEGVYGMPIAVDPLMLYWNRDILTSAGFLEAPKQWGVLLNQYFPSLITRGDGRTIERGVVAMGAVTNVANAAPVVYSLVLQGGSQGVNIRDGSFAILLDRRGSGSGRPFLTAVDFYMRFSQPSNAYFSWDRTLPLDRDVFLREDLAFYLGFGSEASSLEGRNPNLNFDIAELPQGDDATIRRTYGRMYTLAPTRRSQNPAAAMTVLSVLASDQVVERLVASYRLAPLKRSLVSKGSNDLYGREIYGSAPIAFGWLTPDPVVLDSIFARMVDDILAERGRTTDAVDDALVRIQQAY